MKCKIFHQCVYWSGNEQQSVWIRKIPAFSKPLERLENRNLSWSWVDQKMMQTLFCLLHHMTSSTDAVSGSKPMTSCRMVSNGHNCHYGWAQAICWLKERTNLFWECVHAFFLRACSGRQVVTNTHPCNIKDVVSDTLHTAILNGPAKCSRFRWSSLSCSVLARYRQSTTLQNPHRLFTPFLQKGPKTKTCVDLNTSLLKDLVQVVGMAPQHAQQDSLGRYVLSRQWAYCGGKWGTVLWNPLVEGGDNVARRGWAVQMLKCAKSHSVSFHSKTKFVCFSPMWQAPIY